MTIRMPPAYGLAGLSRHPIKTRLSLSTDGLELVSVAAHLAFPIRDGVPMLSLDEAREFDPDDKDEKRRLGIG